MKNAARSTAVAFIVFGCASLVWTAFQLQKVVSFQSNEIGTVGTVVSVETKLVGGRTSTLRDIPTIRFVTEAGKPITFVSDIRLLPYTIQVGQRIPVAYDKNDPEVAHIDEQYNASLWINVLFDFSGALLFFFGSWISFQVAKREEKKH